MEKCYVMSYYCTECEAETVDEKCLRDTPVITAKAQKSGLFKYVTKSPSSLSRIYTQYIHLSIKLVRYILKGITTF